MSKPCDRFEREVLEQAEEGQALDEHFDTCPDCQQARRDYEQIGSALEQVGDAYSPPGDWEARVWAGIASGKAGGRRGRWWTPYRLVATLLPVGGVAVLVVWLLAGPSVAPLPGYTLRTGEGELLYRTGAPAEGEAPRLGPGSRLELVLQPEAAVAAPVSVRSWLSVSGALRPLAVTADVSPTGSAKVVLEADALGPPGRWLLLLVVGRPGSLPDAEEVSAALTHPEPGGGAWRLLRQPLEIVER